MTYFARARSSVCFKVQDLLGFFKKEKKAFWINVAAGVVVAIIPGIPITWWTSKHFGPSPETSRQGQTQPPESPPPKAVPDQDGPPGSLKPPPPVALIPDYVQSCDSLAASPDDLGLDRQIVVEQIKDPVAAVKACEAALETTANRGNPRLYFQRGRAFEATDDYKRAEADYEEARKRGYPPALARFAIAVLVGRTTDTQKRAAVIELTNLQSQSVEARYFVGRSECSGIYADYGFLKNKVAARIDIEAAASHGSKKAQRDRCD